MAKRTNYQRGVEAERKCMGELEQAGYVTARTAGSHGPFDVIGVGTDGIKLIQLKRVRKGGNWKGEYKAAKEKLEQLPASPSISREVWVWEDYNGFIKREVV